MSRPFGSWKKTRAASGAGDDIEDDGELEGEESEESRDLGETQHPDVVIV
jgi:hypothetical protein